MSVREIGTVKGEVERVLRDFLPTRDDDKLLLLEVWRACGLELPLHVRNKILDEMPSPESVRRIRQKFQESGQYRGMNRGARKAEQENMKVWARGQLF